MRIVQEYLETGNCTVVARRYGIASNKVNRWTRNYMKYDEAAFKDNSAATSTNGTLLYRGV
ncbi:MAG TPA: helix-turn-helix domain-containing protein [Syntrophomonadaceae bacterium]|nr:helix-turn-helix domain-containing protein [Syntrophomonadaceae bacterium]